MLISEQNELLSDANPINNCPKPIGYLPASNTSFLHQYNVAIVHFNIIIMQFVLDKCHDELMPLNMN